MMSSLMYKKYVEDTLSLDKFLAWVELSFPDRQVDLNRLEYWNYLLACYIQEKLK